MAKSPPVYDKVAILAHARQFTSRAEWRAACREEQKSGGRLFDRLAHNLGKDFYTQCTAHMTFHKLAAPKVMPKHAWWRQLPEAEIRESALKFKTMTDWHRGEPGYRKAARAKGDAFYAHCCRHMITPSNPFNSQYVIYAFEFADNNSYIGLTFNLGRRLLGHWRGGPVFDHIKICSDYRLKIVQGGIAGPSIAGETERRWIAKYQSDGWIKLNSNAGGGTGGMGSWYSDQEILDSALKFKTKVHWLEGEPWMVTHAKNRGLYQACIFHMPKKAAPRFIPPISEATREKFRAKAKERTSDPAWREAHSKKLAGRTFGPRSAEACSNISAGKLGVKFTAEHRSAISAGKKAARRAQTAGATPPAPAPVSLQTLHTSSSTTASA